MCEPSLQRRQDLRQWMELALGRLQKAFRSHEIRGAGSGDEEGGNDGGAGEAELWVRMWW
jgi:hypothetical protein